MLQFWGKRIVLVSVLATAVGSLASLFLWGLQEIEQIRKPIFLVGLPLIGLLFRLLAKPVSTKDLISSLQGSTSRTNVWSAPFILVSTWVSHLVGASVGREGTAVIMGGAIAETLSEKLTFTKEEKSIWLRAGMSAGFAAIFGTPWAGCFFGLEISRVGKIHWPAIFACGISAFAANYISVHVYGTNHVLYPIILTPLLSGVFWAKLICIGTFLGLLGLGYTRLESSIHAAFERLPVQSALKGIIGGVICLIFFQFSFAKESIGLGTAFLTRPFAENFSNEYFAWIKLVATTLSLGLGFKGGEATPLFLIGSHAASSLSNIIHLPHALLAGIGFVSLYAGLAKTPITGMCLGIELFGYEAWFCYLICTLLVLYISGSRGIFKSQTWASYFPKPPYE